MTPEAADYLSKARDDLDDARKVAAIGLAKIAARAACYAAFHAAEAFIVERTGKIAKTHSGLRSDLGDWRGKRRKSTGPFRFSWQAYKYKEISDYGVGPGAVITMAEADDAVRNAARMIDCVATLLAHDRQ